MKRESQPIKLDNLRIQSFVTATPKKKRLVGGISGNQCSDIPCTLTQLESICRPCC